MWGSGTDRQSRHVRQAAPFQPGKRLTATIDCLRCIWFRAGCARNPPDSSGRKTPVWPNRNSSVEAVLPGTVCPLATMNDACRSGSKLRVRCLMAVSSVGQETARQNPLGFRAHARSAPHDRGTWKIFVKLRSKPRAVNEYFRAQMFYSLGFAVDSCCMLQWHFIGPFKAARMLMRHRLRCRAVREKLSERPPIQKKGRELRAPAPGSPGLARRG